MRQRLSSALTALVLFGAVSPVAAQGTSGTDAGVFLLLPTGAEAVGMGQASVAVEGGSESVWWNPAGLAAQKKREVAIHHAHTVGGSGDVITFVLPSRRRGSAAVSLNIFDPGQQQVTDDQGQLLGTLFPRDLVFAGTYALSITGVLNVGVNYKLVQFRVDCEGECGGTFANSSRAADAGFQIKPSGDSPLAVGFAVRNFGGGLKTDAGKRDALPTRTDTGVLYHIAFLDKYLKDTEVRAAGSVVTTRGAPGASFRLGTDVTYQHEIHFRAGYVADKRDNDSGASVGFGVKSGRVVFDFAKLFGGLSADAGVPPTYLSLRYLF